MLPLQNDFWVYDGRFILAFVEDVTHGGTRSLVDGILAGQTVDAELIFNLWQINLLLSESRGRRATNWTALAHLVTASTAVETCRRSRKARPTPGRQVLAASPESTPPSAPTAAPAFWHYVIGSPGVRTDCDCLGRYFREQLGQAGIWGDYIFKRDVMERLLEPDRKMRRPMGKAAKGEVKHPCCIAASSPRTSLLLKHNFFNTTPEEESSLPPKAS